MKPWMLGVGIAAIHLTTDLIFPNETETRRAIAEICFVALGAAYGEAHGARRRHEKEVIEGLEKRLAEREENKGIKAIYNPRAYRRGRVGNDPYDPKRHFRREGRTDIKW